MHEWKTLVNTGYQTILVPERYVTLDEAEKELTAAEKQYKAKIDELGLFCRDTCSTGKKISSLEADIAIMHQEAMELFKQITEQEVKIASMNRVMTLAGEGHQAKMLEMQNQVNVSERAKLDWQAACRDKDARIAQLQGELDTIGQKHDEEIREIKQELDARTRRYQESDEHKNADELRDALDKYGERIDELEAELWAERLDNARSLYLAMAEHEENLTLKACLELERQKP